MVKFALMDMTIYLMVSRDDLDASYSPFNSETIGSYRYQKSYIKAVQAITTNQPTGAELFDKLVAYLEEVSYAGPGQSLISSEDVFHPGFIFHPVVDIYARRQDFGGNPTNVPWVGF